jgi:hypothetical protein
MTGIHAITIVDDERDLQRPGFDQALEIAAARVTRALLRRARVAVGPGCSLGFDGPEVRLAVGSVGLKATYPATALAAGVAGFETAPGVIPGVSEANHGLEVAGTDGFFEGRGLIERAFVDRLLPILERCRA